MDHPEGRSFLGLDLSTQQLKAVIIDDSLNVIHHEYVQYDADLPEFRTHGGVVQDKMRPRIVTSPPSMWVKALDLLMDKLMVAGVDFSKIAAISGSAQQHGSVFWLNGAGRTLRNLDSSDFLYSQLCNSFSVIQSPVWMDSSTTKQCRQLEEAVDGAENLAELTGSRGYERFTGAQIAKIYQTKPESYANTERISLVSSFACSLFLGDYAPIDYADASGMNLMDLRAKKWDSRLLEGCAPDLQAKLANPEPSGKILGDISSYCVDRWGFDPHCKVVAFTGDNPASLIGMRLQEGWIALSLGTSDTLFLWLKEPKAVMEGHVLCNPADNSAYMALLCFKNGSLTRQRIRDNCCEGSWDTFDQLLESTPRGNFGNFALYYDVQEIVPFLMGDHRYNKAGERVTRFASLEVEVRAVIEGQMVARRAHAEDFGISFSNGMKILATGGASRNKHILQVASDVFNAPVYVMEESNSANLGAAYQAKKALQTSEGDALPSPQPPKLVCEPYNDADTIYRPMVVRYRSIVAQLLSAQK